MTMMIWIYSWRILVENTVCKGFFFIIHFINIYKVHTIDDVIISSQLGNYFIDFLILSPVASVTCNIPNRTVLVLFLDLVSKFVFCCQMKQLTSLNNNKRLVSSYDLNCALHRGSTQPEANIFKHFVIANDSTHLWGKYFEKSENLKFWVLFGAYMINFGDLGPVAMGILDPTFPIC